MESSHTSSLCKRSGDQYGSIVVSLAGAVGYQSPVVD